MEGFEEGADGELNSKSRGRKDKKSPPGPSTSSGSGAEGASGSRPKRKKQKRYFSDGEDEFGGVEDVK